jgi:hypothetical protein
MTVSHFENTLRIAIKSWARTRAREMSDKALKVPDMEQFLAELLEDALLTFKDTYTKAYNEYLGHLEALLDDAVKLKPAAPFLAERKL